ncbi:peptidoglycan-binding domain-containing protein [Dongia sp.]|uniref:peptidoglycan-binding domain-containing protein n=1 Tax=Dongia sp. TaxID=1977262 RepID=UPI0035B02FCB
MDEVRSPKLGVPKLGVRTSAADRIGASASRGRNREAPQGETRHLMVSFGVVAGVLALAIGITLYIWHDVGAPRPEASPQVQEIERLLAELGFTPGPQDGVMDDATAEAIRAYQQVAGLPEDGAATPELLDELRAVAGKSQ